MAYSLDLRIRAMDLLNSNEDIVEVSDLLGISLSSLYRWKKRNNSQTLKPSYPKARGAYRLDEQAMLDYISVNLDAYQHEIASAMGVTKSTIQWSFKRLGITRKKRHHNTKNETKSAALPMKTR